MYVWDVSGPAPASPLATLTGHSGVVTLVAFSRCGDLLASYGWDGTTRLWDPVGHRMLLTVAGEIRPCGSLFGREGQRVGMLHCSREAGVWRVAVPGECRTLIQVQHGTGQPAAMHPGGNILASSDASGVRLWDIRAARQVGFLPVKKSFSVAFPPNGRSLFTDGETGLQRWPVTVTEAKGGHSVSVGSPVTAPLGGNIANFALNRDATVLAVCNRSTVKVVRLDAEGNVAAELVSGSHPAAAWVAVSPDGRWAASGTWKGDGVKVWAVAKGAAARALPVRGNAAVKFSPDGQWLVSGTGEEYHFWHTGTWESGPVVPREQAGDLWGMMAFSGDGRWLALATTRAGGLRLYDASTLEPVTPLEASVDQYPACFSNDGRWLATIGTGGSLQVWDLGLVRSQLSDMNLDWSPTSAAEAQGTTP